MKKKNKTRDIIIVMVIATIVISGILILINVISGKSGETTRDVTSQTQWAELSDDIKNMVSSADISVEYYSSSQRIALYCIGTDNYYGIMYNDSQNMLYLYEGEYTSAATTEALKYSEATGNLNSSAGYQQWSKNVNTFVVEGYDANGAFPSGQVSVTLSVNINGQTRNTFTADIPQSSTEE